MVRQRKPASQAQQAQQPSGGAREERGPQHQVQPALQSPPDEAPGEGSAAGLAAAAAGQASARLHAAACLTAAWLSLLLPQAAYHILSPQTGDWLAGLSSIVLLAVGVGAAAVGTTAVTAWHASGLPPLRSAGAGGGAAAAALWAAAALALCTKAVAQALGRLLLSPGLSLDSSNRVTDTWLTTHTLALALLAFGPVAACLGFASGQAGATALLPHGARTPWLVPLALAALATWAALSGPLGPTLPKPGCSLPALVAVVASAVAAALGEAGRCAPGTPKQHTAARRALGMGAAPRWAAAAAVAALALAHAALRCYPCRHYLPPAEVAGGQYSLLYSCEARLGGYVSVVEGLMSGKYRYRLLRVDHSLVGGEYVAPPDVAGQSVYTAFYLQQAILAARPINVTSTVGNSGVGGAGAAAGRPRSLHIGLGIGTAVKGLQQAGAVADVLELHGEVVEAARAYFGVRPLGRTLVGDALATLPRLADESYDYMVHDVFSGGGAPPALMREAFFRRLRRKLRPGGVVAVNYMGSRGQPLKQLWCRLRLAFDHVRCFGDQERSRVKNYVLFASDDGAGLAGMEAAAAQLARKGAAGGSGATGAGAGWDPPALAMLRALGKAEVRFTFDRQRCMAFLGLEEEARSGQRRRRQQQGGGGGGGGGLLAGPGTNLPPGLREQVQQQQQEGEGMGRAGHGPGTDGMLPWPPGRGPEDMAGLHGKQQGQQQQQQQQPVRKLWAVERWKEEAQRGHAMAAYHWAVMRRQLDDELWQTY